MADAVYIHIPFCANRCYYCDFQTYVTKEPEVVWNYLKALKKEISLHAPIPEIRTLYIGGGTPTFLDHHQMDFLLEMMAELFPRRTQDFEFSMEANPGTTDLDKLKIMKQGSVNRLSYGVQSFNNDLLKKIGRIHNREQAVQAIEEAREAGFSNISLDLMFGLPNQTLSMFEDSLSYALGLEIPHLSAYSLKIEEKTVFYKWFNKDRLDLPDEDTEVAMYQRLIEITAENGLNWYEISNFARPGYISRHNVVYWENRDYYGFGAGAHGYLQGRRFANFGSTLKYIKEIEDYGLAVEDSFSLSLEEKMEDFMILGLRLRKGVSSEEFVHRYGKDVQTIFGHVIEPLVDKGLLVWKEGRLRLSDKGVLFGNDVFAQFLSD